MATIKSYTDLSQSKTLSTILPLESEDMYYQYIGMSIKNGSEKPIYIPMIIRNKSDKDIPCWSLAVLVSEILPDKITVDNENYYLTFRKKTIEYKGPVTKDGQKCISSEADNLVDACYEMILKLNELKKL